MTPTGADEIWEGSGKKYSIQSGVIKKFFILERGPEFFCVLQSPKYPGGGGGGRRLNLDQISSYCTSIQILMRSLQYANIITF